MFLTVLLKSSILYIFRNFSAILETKEAVAFSLKAEEIQKQKRTIMDKINPTYYDQVFDTLMTHKFTPEQRLTISEFNVYKYLYRYKSKNGLEDLKKAKWYLEEMIKIYDILLKQKQENDIYFLTL